MCSWRTFGRALRTHLGETLPLRTTNAVGQDACKLSMDLSRHRLADTYVQDHSVEVAVRAQNSIVTNVFTVFLSMSETSN